MQRFWQIIGILVVIGLIYAVMVGLGITRSFKHKKETKKVMVINDFEHPNYDLDWGTGGYVKVESTTDNQTHGKKAMKATFLLENQFFPTPTPGNNWRPTLTLDTNSPTPLNVYDWSEYSNLMVDVFNPQDQPLTWHIQVADGRAFVDDQATGVLIPKKVTNIDVPFDELIKNRLDLTSIRSFSFWVDTAGLTTPPVIFMDYLRLEGDLAPLPAKKK